MTGRPPAQPEVDFPALYRQSIGRFGDDARAALWHSAESQRARFAVVAEYVRPRDSVLDVGCGPGHLADFLRERSWTGDYLGVDALEEMAALARGRGLAVVVGRAGVARSPLSRQLGAAARFDVVIANGLAAEQPGDERARMAWLGRALRDFERLATTAVVMTFLSSALPPERRLPGRWFARLGKVTEAAAALGHPVLVRHDYRHDDFTVVVQVAPVP